MTAPRYQGTQITMPATWRGIAGEAWRLTLEALGQRGRPDWDATVACGIVRVPNAHSFWDHWLVSVVHLRDLPGVPPATLHRPGATHGLIIGALDPGHPLPETESVIGAGWDARVLRPIDLAEQFIVRNDAEADAIFEWALQAMVNGLASPDQDWRGWWRASLATTTAHLAQGAHPVRIS